MTKHQAWIVAVGCWLLTLALGIAFAATWDEYARLRDGTAVVGTVTRLEPHANYIAAVVRYPRNGETSETLVYPRGAEARSYAVGTQVPLVYSSTEITTPERLDAHRPSPLLALGAALAFGLGVACARIPSVEARRRAARTSALDALVDAARRTRNVAVAGVILLLMAAGFFAVVGYYDDEATDTQVVVIDGMAAVCVLVAGVVGARAYRLRDPANNPTLTMIVQRPWEIAWVYQQVLRGRYGVEVRTAFIWRDDGKVETLRLVPEDIDAVFAEIYRRAPHARRGYDRATEKLYRENPARWRPAPPTGVAG